MPMGLKALHGSIAIIINYMFDVQRYFNVLSVAYLVFELGLNFTIGFGKKAGRKNNLNYGQNFVKNILFIGTLMTCNHIGGFLGGISQLNWFSEGSTLFICIREVLKFHKMDGIIFTVNELLLMLTFSFFRIFFVNYMIFWKIQDFALYRYHTFWATYPSEHY